MLGSKLARAAVVCYLSLTSLALGQGVQPPIIPPSAGGVTSITAADSTLTISPMTAAVAAQVNQAANFTWSGTHNFTNLTGVTITSPGDFGFVLKGKIAAFQGSDPVATLYPVDNNHAMVFDCSPHGTAVEFGYGACWIDLSTADTTLNDGTPHADLHLDASLANSRLNINGTEFNAGTLLPLYFGMQNGDTAVHTDSFFITAPDAIFQEVNGYSKQVRTVTAAGAVTIAKTDHIVCINKTSGAATTANLFASPRTGTDIIIKDCKGDAATNNITITPAAGNIDNASTYVININYGAWEGTYNGTAWSTVIGAGAITAGSGLTLLAGVMTLGDVGLGYTSPGVMTLGNSSVQSSLTIGGTVGGELALQPPAYTVKTLDQGQASGGTTLLAFASVSGLSVGNIATGTNVPLGDQIAAINSNAQATFASNGTAASGQKVIPSILTNNCKVGQQVIDNTTPTAIGPGNVIASIQGSVSYTMTANLVANVGNGDSFTCDPTVTLQQATTAALSSGATVNFTAQFTSLNAASSSYNPGDASVLGNLNLGGQINFGAGANSGTLRIFSNGAVGLGLNALTGVATPPSFNVAIGFNTLTSASLTGQSNIAIGGAAMQVETTGVGNVAIGVTAMQHHLTGNNNVAIGNLALGTSTTGVNNSCIGDGACETATGQGLTALGQNTLGVETTGNNNTAIGQGSLQTITTGQSNTALGQEGSSSPGITTGSNNLLLGDGITGLSAGLTGAIVLATAGTIRADFGNTTAGQWTLSSALGVTGAAATVTTSQISYGGTTAAASNCNVASPTPAGCVVINVAGTTHYLPYY